MTACASLDGVTMRKQAWFGLAAAAALGGTGCATMAHGSRQSVIVTSEPPGARVTVLTAAPGAAPVVRSIPGVTPITLELTRRDPHIVIRFDSTGCAPVDVVVKRAVSGWVAGNLIVTNPVSMQGMTNPGTQYPVQVAVGLGLTLGLDAISGAMWKLPARIHATLCTPQREAPR